MDKVGFKYSSLAPKANEYKANELENKDENKIVSDDYLEDPVGQNTAAALDELINGTESAETDAQVNAFGIQLSDNSSVSVPGLLLTIDELYQKAAAAGINIGLSELSQIEKMYKESDKKLSLVRAKLIEKIESGTLTASDVEIARQQIGVLDKSFAIREESLKKIPVLRAAIEENIKAEYTKFMQMAASVAKAYNEGSAQERSDIVNQLMTCDIDGNGIIGDNIKILTNTSVGSVLWDMDAEKPVKRIAASGAPITSKLYDPEYKWTMSDSLKMEGSQSGGRATFKVDGTPQNDSIDLVVPDYIACYVDDNGELKETSYDGERYLCATGLKSEAGKIVQTTPETGNRVQHVRVARVEVYSEEIEGKSGYDLKYRLLTANGQIAFEGTIKGSNGYSASDYRVNILSDLKMLDDKTSLANASGLNRTEPVVIDAKRLISTCKYSIGNGLYDRIMDDYDIDLNKLGIKNPQARDVFEKNLKEMYNNGTWEKVDTNSPNFNTEAMGPVIMGFGSATVYGSETSRNLVLFSKNDQSMAPAEGSSEDVNPLASKIFVGNDNYNIVISDKTGNLRASGVTLAYKDSGSLKTNDAVSVTNIMGIKSSGQANMYETVNVPVFVALTGRGTKMVDNESDINENHLNANGNPDPQYGYGDDCFIGDTISYSIPKSTSDGKVGDPDASTNKDDGALDPSAIASDALKFEDAVEGLDDLEDNAEKYYSDIKPEGEIMNQTDAELDAFFAEVALVFGQADQWLNDPIGDGSSSETLEEELAKKASEEAE